MNTPQKLILAGGAILLVLNFVFPYSSYPTIETGEEKGGFYVRSTVKWGFYPIWQALGKQENAALPGNLWDHPIIQWPTVILFAVGIIILCGWAIIKLGREPVQAPAKGEKP